MNVSELIKQQGSEAKPLDPQPPTRDPLNNQRLKLLIVEDDEDVRAQMKWAMARDYEILTAGNRAEAMAAIRSHQPQVVILDLGLPPHPASTEEGFATLAEAVAADPHVKVVIVTGRAEKEHALKAIAQGAYDILYKPVQLDELGTILKRAYHVSALEREHAEMQLRMGEEAFEGMLGTSPRMQDVFSTVRKVANSDVPVLITGESGTGKELIALAIHQLGRRRGGPFVVINCGAIPETLLESELFGHEKGAFTGAHILRKGRIESADKGTLVLDEIGELSLPLQVKILRYLQEQTIERIGGREQHRVDARVIAATNRDLKQAMIDGKFREDLYFRIGVVSVALPALKERNGDALLIANAFLLRYAKENRKKISGFASNAVTAIESYNWPGNVRELENRVKRAVIMAEGRKVSASDLELEAPKGKYEGLSLRDAREALEKEMVLRVLSKHNDNITRASEELGISRPTLYELMEKLGIARK
jgi:two-component system NtrC family response regulator